MVGKSQRTINNVFQEMRVQKIKIVVFEDEYNGVRLKSQFTCVLQ
ncbi:unnamed protein product [Paramecium pentaurelia]|uniref:Uncharacterized protein n=1 Tax=Paramecium pentaurelia TaxID=43138 RepID=A0A8S1V6W0_9CILI|nr:unnamed protein product [Paramecium pentaurelia]